MMKRQPLVLAALAVTPFLPGLADAQAAPVDHPAATPAVTELDAGLDRYTRNRAAHVLDEALESPVTLWRARMLRAASDRAATLLGPASRVASALTEDTRGEDDIDTLERLFERTIDDLRFEPTMEAPVPENWPPTAPVREVVLKSYPEYRMARTPAPRGQQTQPFWRLFNHIKSSEIAMTAPVQMDAAATDSEAKMAFLYRVEEDGPLGHHHGVDVIDVPPRLAISVGGRGYNTNKVIRELEAALEDWLAVHPDLKRAGPRRVMGYNGPGMRGDRRFFEVEIPVQRRAETVSPKPATPESAEVGAEVAPDVAID